MKSTKLKKLILPIIISSVQLSADAYDFCSDGIYYNITGETTPTVEVTYEKDAYDNYSGDIVIPETVNYNGKAYTVTRIGDRSFMGCSQLTSLVLPSTLTSIGNAAIFRCPLITELNIPESVTSIEASAFSSCTSLTSMTLPEQVTVISDWLFESCKSLETVNMSKHIKSLGQDAFKFCNSLKSIDLGDRITSIPDGAFYECMSLESIVVPDGVTSIGWSAFARCMSLKEVKLGSKIEKIDKYAFSTGSSLEKFTCLTVTPPECELAEFGNGVFYDSNVQDATLYVPTGALGAYQSARQWRDFGNIVETTPMPSIVSIENVVKHPVDNTKFTLTCTVKCENAKYLNVEVEEQYSTTLRSYRFDNPETVEVETGAITSLYNSTVIFIAVNEAGETQEILEFTPPEAPMADGLYYSGTDGKIYCIDNEGNTTVFDEEELPHTFQLLHVGDRIYGASAGNKFTFLSNYETGGDGKLFYISNYVNGEKEINVVLDNEGANHNRDPYGLAAYKDDIYVFDRSETIRKVPYSESKIPQDYPSWLENSWISFYGRGWSYGCIKSDFQITEVNDANGNPEPVFWLTINYSGNGLFRFKNEAIRPGGYGNSSYNKSYLFGLRSTAFCFDEANDDFYIVMESNRGSGLYRAKLSKFKDSTVDAEPFLRDAELIDGSPVRHEGTGEEHVGVPQLSIDNNGEYLYWCYRAPTSNGDYDYNYWAYYDETNPMHQTGIKRIKLGQANPVVEIVAPGVEGYGVVAINYKGQNQVSDIVNDSLSDGPVEYYNLQGILISNPERGSIVIRRQGNKVTKIRY